MLGLSLGLTLGSLNSGRGTPLLPGFSFTKEAYATWAAGLAATGCDVEDLGVGSDGSTIYGLSYGDPAKKSLFFTGVVHGAHEWRNAYILRQFMTYVANPPVGFESRFERILDTYQIHTIPCANPSGYTSGGYGNANNVNINRNFPAFWEAYNDAQDIIDHGNGKGSAAGSELETQIIMAKALDLLPYGFIDFHIMGAGTSNQLEVLTGADEEYWEAFWDRFVASTNPESPVYYQRPGQPQSQQWVRSLTADNGHQPMTATFEPGSTFGEEEHSRLGLNLALQFCLKMVDQVEQGWPQAAATVSPFQPAAAGIDAQISAAAANGNFGANLLIGVGDQGGTGIRRGLLAFAFTSVPPGADVESAIITLWVDSESATTDYTINVHRALKQWYEGVGVTGETPGAGVDASTWNNRNHNGTVAWGTAGGQSGVDYEATPTASAVVTTTGVYLTWDVTEDVRAFANGTKQNFGWFLINESEGTANSRKQFTSSDQSAVPARRPKLDITYK